MKPRIGDFVTATLVKKGRKQIRQGVYVRNNHDGTVIIQGEMDKYLCRGPDNLEVVPDHKLFGDTIQRVLDVRENLCLH